jgi:hypothetical protein
MAMGRDFEGKQYSLRSLLTETAHLEESLLREELCDSHLSI